MNNYEVGQVWITRDGREATIRRLLHNGEAVIFIAGTTGNGTYGDGEWWIGSEGQFRSGDEHEMDLISLKEDYYSLIGRRQPVDTIYGRI